ncbi:TonB-dependent receptor [Vibrio mimicus]
MSGMIISLCHASLALAEETNSSQASAIPTITVYGEKVARSMQETSASVEVFDENKIDSMPNATDVTDLLQSTPNIVDVGVGNDVPAIRGIDGSGAARGANAFLNGTRPRMNVSLDGRSLTYNELAFGPQSLWDLQQVEVYRGPQSYIQGRNVMAGAVVLQSKDPTYQWESSVHGSYGEQGYSQTAAVISSPIIDNELAFRLSIDRQTRESFVDMPSYEPVGDPRDIETITARGKLLYEPSAIPGLSTKLTLNHFDSRAPQNEALVPSKEHQSARYDERRPVFETKNTSGIWDLEYQTAGNLRFENQIAYTDFTINRRTATTLPYANIDGAEIHVEPVLHFATNDDRWRGLAGLRYYHSSQEEYVYLFGGSTFDDKTETGSAFAEVTYAVLPAVNLTLAARLESEHRTRKGGSSTVKVDFDETYNVFLPKADVVWKINRDHTVGAMVAKGYNAGGAGMTFDIPYTAYTYDEEYVWSYEMYTRHRLLDAQVELTSNFFYNDYDDLQLPFYISARTTKIINAEKAQTYGAEFSSRWLPISDLELSAALGLLKTEISKFSGSEYEGNELPRSPSYSMNFGADYTFFNDFVFSTTVNYTDTYYSYYDNDEMGKIDADWITNVQLAYNFSMGRATLFATNLFNSTQPTMITDNDVYTAVMQQPRLVGVSLQLDF